jgi:transcription elongation factor Elf1
VPETDRTLTQEMVRDDIDRGGARCPFCGSDEIEAGRLDAEADSAWGPVTCTACEQEWQDVSFLGAIDLTADDGQVTTIMPWREG